MKIKNSELTQESIKIITDLTEMHMNPNPAFKLLRIIKEISSILEIKISLEKKILEKYIERDNNKNPIPATDQDGNIIDGAVKISNVAMFNKEMDDLNFIENDIPYEKVDFEDLGISGTLKISDLRKIDFLFN